MKRFTLIAALLLMVAMPMMAKRVSPETAQKVAKTFLNNNGAKAAQLTDLSKAAGFPNLYIFNAETGFVVMAEDDCVQPILGYSLTGRFVAENMPTNVSGWLQGYNDEIQYAIDNKLKATTETAKLWKDLIDGNSKAAKATVVVDALIQTTWDQNGSYYYIGGQWQLIELYNNLCPYDYAAGERTVTGCVATAMAQIMKYWNYPTHGISSHSYTPSTRPEFGEQYADFNSTDYDWNNMPNSLTRYSPDNQINAIATLMYHCGVSVDMDYDIGTNGGSAAYNTAIAPALINYFNYKSTASLKQKSSYGNNEWISLLKTELDAGRPIEYNGSGYAGGHAFVCDGYDNNNKFHFNWGWSGANDGFYALTNLNPGSGGSGGGSYNFTQNQTAVIGIQPSANDAIPTNLSYTLEGLQSVTLNWTSATGAASYNIYRNNNYIGNSSSTTYSETAPFGTNVYYVRSLDANGELSLSSNTVTVAVAYQTPIVDDLEATLSGNDISLSWTAPDWCYPETPTATLNYGTGTVNYSWTYTYYAHRHLAANLAQYAGKAVYKVSTYIQYPGTYSVYIYTKSTSANRPDPNSLAFSNTGIQITLSSNWYEFNTNGPIILTGTDDLWVVMKQEGTGQQYPTPSFNLPSHNTNAFYAGSSPTYLYDAGSNYNCAWFINTYLTDGTYTYNLYQDGTKIAENINNTTYEASLNNNTANQFVVKTIYYDGEAPSNMIGYAKGEASLASMELNPNDKMTVIEGSKLTVSDTLNDVDASNLILENEAQLIHNTAGVKATVKKDIAGYNRDSNSWNFIASPVTENFTPSAENGLLNGTYDLYYYDEPTHYWMNHKAATFDLAHKQGYLYANQAASTLQFEGTLAPSGETVSVTGLSHSASSLNGFNLVGNPFACNATIDQDCYVIDGDQIILATTTPVLTPCEGVMVKANSDTYTVTFTKAIGAKANSNGKCLDLVVTKGGVSTGSTTAVLDRARVRFGEGTNMEKFSLNQDNTQISLWQDGQTYAVAYTDGTSELPINFKSAENGSYTIGIEENGLETRYLHLIDNMTGEDIDLLATPNYTFTAKTTDYESRFRLMFKADEENSTSSTTFAYLNNGEIVINGASSNATLQIVDVTGRVVVSCEDVSENVSTNGITAGVYVLRLIDGETIRMQKIVLP